MTTATFDVNMILSLGIILVVSFMFRKWIESRHIVVFFAFVIATTGYMVYAGYVATWVIILEIIFLIIIMYLVS